MTEKVLLLFWQGVDTVLSTKAYVDGLSLRVLVGFSEWGGALTKLLLREMPDIHLGYKAAY